MSSTAEPHSSEAYTVAWIAALPHERAAGMMMLDERYRQSPKDFSKNESDPNTYSWGRIGHHYVVIASLPAWEYGTTTTAITVQGLRSSLPHIRIGLLVGIGAGVPGEKHHADGTVTIQRDIRLGDVVVSNPDGANGGVVQYDFIKAKKSIELKGFLNSPPQALRNALAVLQAEHELEDSKIAEFVAESLRKHPKAATPYSRPAADSDRLFKSTYSHPRGDTCQSCSQAEQVGRPSREASEIHYGSIASGNTLVKDAQYRDEIVSRLKTQNVDPLCFEMEAAGLMNTFPCMVIRGICDYGDSHKNDDWQRYAALAAAAFAKEFLGIVDAEEVRRIPELRRVLENTNAQRDKTHQWLSPPDPSTNHNKALQQRHAGTGHWFVKGETFSSFKDGVVPILWLHGIPGCGKTVLSSTIVEDLRASSAATATALLYFYFDFNDQRKQTFDSALRSLVCQMAHQSDSAFDQLDHLRRNGQPSTQELSQILKKMLNGGDSVTIVLDALDECTTRDELLKWIQQLMASEIGSVQMVVSSRQEHDINLVLEKIVGKKATIPLEQGDVDVDIGAYVHARIRTDSDWERWRSKPQVQHDIEVGLMEKAKGMFRWAACQLDSLAKCVSRPQLTQALTTLPATLDGTYARILDQIPDEYRQDSIRLLQVLTWSERPLRIEELVDFLAVDLHNEPGFDVENRMPVPREILRLCSSLVTMMEASQDWEGWYSAWEETNSDVEEGKRKYGIGDQGEQTTREMQLAHFSVKEYLISERLDERYQVHLREMPSAACIASASLTYLLNIGGDNDLAELKTKFPLSRYSARYWTDFAALAETSEDRVLELAMRLLSDRRACARWLSLWDPEVPWQEEPRNRRELPQPLYYAALFGLERSTSALIDKGVDVNAQGGDHGNALQAACSKGRKKIAEMLISNGADNAPKGYNSTALQAACAEGHEKTAELLLSHGVDVNAPGQKYGTALQAACARGHEKTAELLFSRGADVHAQGGEYGNALQAACIEGYMGIAEMLLSNGADVDAQGGHFDNALQAACAGGPKKIAEMLLSHGADVNARGRHFGSALNVACLYGRKSIAEWLLDNGANVNAQSEGKFSNAVSAARAGRNREILEMLLARGSDQPAPSHRNRR
ncbi:hypothetical protein LTR29_015734 [Friedmanniomyces endolithicus]|nr:hypothetical protein LTR29_015734 [Friedmanniomyces endolithicus]